MDTFVLNINQFGSGVGLVLVGWMAGLVVSYVFSMVRQTGKLG